MHFKLICLYKDGVALDKNALAESPAHVGNLVIEDWAEGSTFKRPVRYARLLHETFNMTQVDIIPPLFDPVAIRMTKNQLTLTGYQIGMRDGVAVHYLQSWAICMTERTE